MLVELDEVILLLQRMKTRAAIALGERASSEIKSAPISADSPPRSEGEACALMHDWRNSAASAGTAKEST